MSEKQEFPWRAWKGGVFVPFDGPFVVEVELRDGRTLTNYTDRVVWKHIGGTSDIIRWRRLSPLTAKEQAEQDAVNARKASSPALAGPKAGDIKTAEGWKTPFTNKDRIGSAAQRKAAPLVTGLVDYFPDALIEVAKLSKIGNDQHNPGEPLHHARSKSGDEADALLRHLIDRGTIDGDGVRHSTKLAWRALANLQKELEEQEGKPLPRGARQ